MALFGWLAAALGIFFHARPEGWGVIIGLILPLTLHALVRLKIIDSHLRREREALELVRGALAKTVVENGAYDDAVVQGWRSHVPDSGLVDRVIASVWASRHSPNPDLEAMATMLSQSEAGRLSAVRGAPNRLLLAGLLGTVAGLAGVVGSLGPQLQGALRVDDPRQLTANLAETLHHMQDAFACTAWGILTAIIVGALINFTVARQSDLLADVQRFGLEELAPRLFPRSERAQLEDVRRVLDASQHFVERVATLMQTAASEFRDVLTSAGSAMTSSVERLETVASNMEASLGAVAADVRDSAVRLDASAERLAHYQSDLQNAYTSLLTLFNQSKVQLEEQARDQLTKIGELQQQFAHSAAAIVGRVDGVNEQLSNSAGAFTKMGDRFYQSGLELNTKLDTGFGTLTETIRQTLDAHRREMGQVEEGLRLVGARLDDLCQRMDPQLLPKGEWAAVRDALVVCTRELQRIHAERSDLSALIVRLDQVASAVSQGSATSHYSNGGGIAGVAQQVDTGPLIDVIQRQNAIPTLSQIQRDISRIQQSLDDGVFPRLFGRKR